MSDMIPQFDEISGPTPKAVASGGRTHDKTEPKREPARYWLNVGVVRGEKLLTLPMGIPLDKLKAKPIPNKASDFQQLRAGEADLWKAFKAEFEKLKPGESKKLNLTCEIRMTSEAEAVEEDTNPYAVGALTF
jgi:hypothetical protein